MLSDKGKLKNVRKWELKTGRGEQIQWKRVLRLDLLTPLMETARDGVPSRILT